jgi:hypothetical protein
VIVDPDGARRLSEGLLVEASVVARLLRMRLLVVDASLIVAPAHVKGRARAAADTAAEPLGADTAGEPLGADPPRARAGRIGAGLAAAERCLSEGADSLARSRR